MLHRPARFRRRGAVLVEGAIVYPVFFMLILGAITTGLGVAYYQRVALMAREGARWAAVHGGQYAKDQNVLLTTAANVYTNAIVTQDAGLDTTSLTYSVTWGNSNQMPGTYTNGQGKVVLNAVTVTVNYQWTPLLYITGPITVTRSATMTMNY
jgi:Flp pilus assembly protein TadG